MKTVYVKGVCCKGCAKELEGIFKKIYGISNVIVSTEDCTVRFDGFVSQKVIIEALQDTKYQVDKIESD